MKKFLIMIALQIVLGENMTPKVKVVPAIDTREILDTVVYEGSVPLILEVDIPFMVYSSKMEDCTEDDTDCYFRNTMHYLYRNIEEDISVLKNVTNSRPERQIVVAAAAATGYFLGPAIKRITTSLFGDDDLERQINVMHDGFNEVVRKTEEYSMQMSNVLEEAKKKIMDNTRVLTQLEQTLKNSIKGIYDIVQGKSLNAQFHQGVSECLAQNFPVSIVPLKRLRKHLVALNSELKNKNYKIALPLDDLSVYSKLSLTDCVIIDSVLKIVVNIPVVAVDTKWVLFEVTHNKFGYHGQVCEVWPSEAMFVATDRHNDRTVMITRNLLKHCSPYETKICLVPRFSRDSTESLHCVKTMLKNTPIEYLKAHCGFRCYDDEEVDIKQNTLGTILITNAKNVTLYCDNSHFHYDIPPIGSLELTLGCSCKTYVNNIQLDNPLSCIEKGYYVHDHLKLSIPNVWTKLDNLLQGSNSEHANHSDILDNTWHSRVPILNFTKRFEKTEHDDTSFYISVSLAGFVGVFVTLASWAIYKIKKQLSKLFGRSKTIEMIENVLDIKD